LDEAIDEETGEVGLFIDLFPSEVTRLIAPFPSEVAIDEAMGELDPPEEDPFGVFNSIGADSKGRDDPD